MSWGNSGIIQQEIAGRISGEKAAGVWEGIIKKVLGLFRKIIPKEFQDEILGWTPIEISEKLLDGKQFLEELQDKYLEES